MSTTSSKTIILEGAATAKSIIENLSNRINGYTTTGKRKPALAVILVGNDQSSAERQAIPLLADSVARNAVSLLTDGTW